MSMKRVAAALAIAVCALPLIASGAQRRVRRVQYSSDNKIADLVQDGDEIVSLERFVDTLHRPVVPGDQEIQAAAMRSDLVVLVEVDRVTGVPSENDTWIDTRVEGAVRQVLKSSRPALADGDRITATYTGGEMVVGTVTVRASQGDELLFMPRFTTPARYLLFLGEFNDILEPRFTPLLVVGDRVVFSWHDGVPVERIRGVERLPLTTILRLVRQTVP